MTISWEVTYNIVMGASNVRRWLFRTDPPCMSEIVDAISHIPVFYGLENSPDISPGNQSFLNTAGMMAISHFEGSIMLGFTFSYRAQYFACFLRQQLIRHENEERAEQFPVNRCAVLLTEYEGEKMFLVMTFHWLPGGALIIFTNNLIIDSLGLQGKSRTESFEFRMFPSDGVNALFNAFGNDPTRITIPESSIVNVLCARVHQANHDHQGTNIENRDMSTDGNYYEYLEDARFKSPRIWNLYRKRLLYFHGRQGSFNFAVSKRVQQNIDLTCVYSGEFRCVVNVSTTIVMNSCLLQLFEGLGLNKESIVVDQRLLGFVEHDDNGSANPNAEKSASQASADRSAPVKLGQNKSAELTAGVSTTQAKARMWRCEICGREIKGKKSNLLRHTEAIHEKTLPFTCQYPGCMKRFQTKSTLSRHVLAVHNLSMFSCRLCRRNFKTERTLDNHIKSAHVHESAWYRCHVCQRCFATNSSRKRHFQQIHCSSKEEKNR